jgi:predicted outer membrane repeat protein
LFLGGCNLQGNITTNATGHSVFSLPALKEFHVEAAGESCTSKHTGVGGQLPIDLVDAFHLQVLGIYCNAFTGTLLALASLTQLVQVDAHFNLFSGPLPSLIKSAPTLRYFSVANNQLNGTVPADYSKMAELTTFGIAFNQFEGPLGVDFASLSNLIIIYIRNNQFTGMLPLPSPHAAVYDADNNQFTQIPEHICEGPLPSAFKNTGGCHSDWPNQPIDTCCLAGNILMQCPNGTDAPPACLINCDAACISSNGTSVASWTALSSQISRLEPGKGAKYLLPEEFSSPADGFSSIAIRSGTTVSIDGGGHAVIDAHGKDRIFSISGGTLFITGVVMQNGLFHGDTQSGGGAISIDATRVELAPAFVVQFVDCTFKNNTAPGDRTTGGAIYAESEMPAQLKLDGCTFISNTVQGQGAIALGSGNFAGNIKVQMVNCSFSGNTEGAMAVFPGAAVQITNCSFNGHAPPSGMFQPAGGVDSINIQDALVTFTCPLMSTGTPVKFTGIVTLPAEKLPPATEIVNCTPTAIYTPS